MATAGLEIDAWTGAARLALTAPWTAAEFRNFAVAGNQHEQREHRDPWLDTGRKETYKDMRHASSTAS